MGVDSVERWRDLDRLFARQGSVVGSRFVANPSLRSLISEHICVLCVGAGGLGCELLKDLALSGFTNIHVIDMDTIDVSNLNRQFLFRMSDVGKYKAEVAATQINKRILGTNVVPHCCRIEEKGIDFYEQFNVFVLGLDSLEARRHMNMIACSFLEYDEDGAVDPVSVKPVIDGGTEGFKGHARVILPGITPCFECTLWMFPPQVRFPLCTLAETPRTPAHCIEYAHLVLWEETRKGETFDPDKEEHMMWVYTKSKERADAFGIQNVTLQLTQGVVKNIIPAIASTNAIVAATCSLEVLKAVSACSTQMDNYMMYNGGDGVYSQTISYERSPDCSVCSSGVPFVASREMTLRQFIDALLEDARLVDVLSNPSVSYGATRLYVRGVFEQETRVNLDKTMGSLVPDDNAILEVNDKKIMYTLKVRLVYK